jgi:hypothetical protein
MLEGKARNVSNGWELNGQRPNLYVSDSESSNSFI